MSYCRFSDADVYVFLSVNGVLECCACRMGYREDGQMFPDSFYATSTAEMLLHLEQHRAEGHDVPAYATDRLIEERDENDVWLSSEEAQQERAAIAAASREPHRIDTGSDTGALGAAINPAASPSNLADRKDD